MLDSVGRDEELENEARLSSSHRALFSLTSIEANLASMPVRLALSVGEEWGAGTKARPAETSLHFSAFFPPGLPSPNSKLSMVFCPLVPQPGLTQARLSPAPPPREVA